MSFSRKPQTSILVSLAAVLTVLLVACGGGNAAIEPGITVSTVGPSLEPTPMVVNAPDTPDRPRSGRWIDVDVTRLEVQLMDGDRVIQTIGPVAVGEEIDTGVFESTQTGLFRVYVKTQELTYDAPYDTYISDWVGFDPDKANGFHSFLKDAGGDVVDTSTGKVSNGCIRTGAAEAVFAFAEIGMPVLVHT